MDQTNQVFWEAAAAGDLSKVVVAVNQGADSTSETQKPVRL